MKTKNYRRLVSLILTMILALSFLATTAMAADVDFDLSPDIYVDGVLVGEADFCTTNLETEAIEVYVQTYNKLVQILPQVRTLSNVPSNGPYNLIYWADRLGYDSRYLVTALYIETSNGPTFQLPDNNQSAVEETATVYVNGVRIKGTNITVETRTSNPKAYVYVPSVDVPKLFPSETKGLFFTQGREKSSLADWAERYGYKLRISGNNVFLNNNGESPVVVTINGVQMDFPYYGGTVVNPGYTMVPVRVISEYLGCSVEWLPEKNRVDIKYGSNWYLALWFNNKTYWKNGEYKAMDVAPFVRNGTTLVPLRIVSEELGYKVGWTTEDGVCYVSLTK